MGANENQVRAAIKKMAAEQRWMATRDITVEDLRQLFIPEQYRHSLQEAFALASPQYIDQYIHIPVKLTGDHYPDEYPMPFDHGQQFTASFSWHRENCPEGFFTMQDHEPMIQPDAPQELVDKWLYVSDNLLRISYEFGLVREVFERLNTNGFCNTPQQMRFLWPAIRHIVDKAGGLGDLGKNLVDSSARAGDRARVPHEVKDYMVATVNIVNRTLLMDKIDMSADRPFRLAVNDPTWQAPISNSVEQIPNLVFRGMQ